MPKGIKYGGRNFPKGVSGNPAGKPKMSEEERNFRTAGKAEIIQEFKDLWDGSEKWLQLIYDDNKTPALRKWMAKAFLNGIKTGDLANLDRILDRVIGKSPEEMNIKGSLHAQLVAAMSKYPKRGE